MLRRDPETGCWLRCARLARFDVAIVTARYLGLMHRPFGRMFAVEEDAGSGARKIRVRGPEGLSWRRIFER
jgi:hypothetical protein